MIYRVTGRMRIGMQWQRFSLELLASKPNEAIEKAYSDLGSRHKLKRSMIKIEDVREVSKDEVKHNEVSQLMSIEALVKW
ncbi:50S ribosomal protein L18Ae [Vulcanisaeta souniana]|uniref:Large ribosomal subunit protein eL20 n=1 Tax=Vulcanisaeta souniana JCM 11219 TaxID=1293586 RepID=A0A830EA69_9CREN|nr:50S ribosomal protein L18Ae [Vulcanisaeta souniana]BDR90934.1 50S ribosomal protein L18a [Vulcanisaeta souniana JCM 11219]GGI79440.1 50S ribosomal protein L18a [Vulcanisaeta souniana JCM 11219]